MLFLWRTSYRICFRINTKDKSTEQNGRKAVKTSSYLKLLLFVLTLSLTMRATAQQVETIPVHFAGRIQSVNGVVVVINQISIDATGASVNSTLAVGSIVVIDGELRMNGVVAARTISGYVPSQESPTQTVPLPTVEPPKNFVSSGQIEALNGTTLTLNGQQIVVHPNDPILPSLHVGDQVDIVGLQFADHVEAITISRIEPTPASVIIEGVVQQIDKEVVTVNDQQIRFAPRDTLLTNIKVGDSLRIEGRYEQTPQGLVFQVTQAMIIASAPDNNGDQTNEDSNNNSRGMGKGMGG